MKLLDLFENICVKKLLQAAFFKTSVKNDLLTRALQLNTDLTEWPLKISALMPAFCKVCFNQPDIAEEKTGVSGLIVLNSSCECSSYLGG